MTDRLKTGDKLTVPVFTDICSAVCWGGNIGTIHDCPYNGKRWEEEEKEEGEEEEEELSAFFGTVFNF